MVSWTFEVGMAAGDGQEGHVGRLRARDPRAIEEMVTAHGPRISRLVYRLSGWSRREAEDLVQETFARAIRGIGSFDGRSSISTWLTRVAINVCRAENRKRVFRASWWERAIRGRAGGEEGRPDDVERGERAREVIAAVGRLGGTYREVVVLRYLEEMGIAEICAATGLSEAAVEVRLHRGRKKLREMLSAYGEER